MKMKYFFVTLFVLLQLSYIENYNIYVYHDNNCRNLYYALATGENCWTNGSAFQWSFYITPSKYCFCGLSTCQDCNTCMPLNTCFSVGSSAMGSINIIEPPSDFSINKSTPPFCKFKDGNFVQFPCILEKNFLNLVFFSEKMPVHKNDSTILLPSCPCQCVPTIQRCCPMLAYQGGTCIGSGIGCSGCG